MQTITHQWKLSRVFETKNFREQINLYNTVKSVTMIFTPFGQFRLETNRFRFKDRIDSNLDFFSIERNKFHKNTQPLGYLHVCGFLCEGEPGQESFLFHLNRPNILKNYTHRIAHRFLLLGGKNHEKLILRNLFGTNTE